MLLSDVSVKRPVFASVVALLLVVFGVISFLELPLREYPAIDPPVVTIKTNYRGAAAQVVENRITEAIEERISGIEGIKFISSTSEDGQSSIRVEFSIDRDIDAAANDIRDRVASVSDDLPDEADPPEISKITSDDDVILWLHLASDRLSVSELTDYADRYLVDRFSVIDGVARVRIGGGQKFAMRVWLDRRALAGHNLTVADVENALQRENIELPAGNIESIDRQFTVRVQRAFSDAEDFQKLVLYKGDDGHLVQLGDVARVELGQEVLRTFFRGNGEPMVGIGIIKQSQANTIAVVKGVKGRLDEVNQTLPEGMTVDESYDTSVFISKAIIEVYKTLAIALFLVVGIIYLFLGSVRATIVPAVTVPVSIIATFMALLAFDFSINLLTLLALVLAIGLVVDDAIVVLENIYRRMEEKNETPLVAAFNGTRQVGFAVIATTLVLLAVFIPFTFLEGDIGRLFAEFAVTLSVAVVFSSFVALTLCPMLASKVLRVGRSDNKAIKKVDDVFQKVRSSYVSWLDKALHKPKKVLLLASAGIAAIGGLFMALPSEYAPKEDRGAFFVIVNGPEGATYSYMKDYMDEIENRLMPYIKKGEMQRLLVRAPRTFSNFENFNSGIVIAVLSPWGQRRPADAIMGEVAGRLAGLPGVMAFPVMRQGFSQSIQKPVQFVIGGSTYDELTKWRDIMLTEINKNNPGLTGLNWDYKETKPQLKIDVDYNRAAELGVRVQDIGLTLETMLGSRRVTNFMMDGEEYDVLVEGERNLQNTAADLQNIYVRSEATGELIPVSNMVEVREFADSTTLNRYNRVRAITIEANLGGNLTLGQALEYLEDTARQNLPEKVIIDYKGQSLDFKSSGSSIWFVYLLGILVVFLVLAAQFESYVHPAIIITTVPMAMLGGLLALFITGSSINIYSQIGLIMLVGLAAKNGILIVEFANQLRDQGTPFAQALKEAAATRFRPVVMTSVTTAAGTIPLILATGAGAASLFTIGVTVMGGVLVATVLTLLLVPLVYSLMAENTGSPNDVARQLEADMEKQKIT